MSSSPGLARRNLRVLDDLIVVGGRAGCAEEEEFVSVRSDDFGRRIGSCTCHYGAGEMDDWVLGDGVWGLMFNG